MKTAFTSMEQVLWLAIGLLIFSCSQQGTRTGRWLGQIKYPDITYRMVFENTDSTTKLYNVTFKRYDIPMDTIFFHGDSVYLRFSEFFTAFEGHYDRKTNSISGTWIAEDSTRTPVTFKRIKSSDTLRGMNPRATPGYIYQSPKNEHDQWAVSSLADQSIDKSRIDSLTYAIMKEKYPDVHSLLIARNDSLIYEEYFYTFNSKTRQNIQSVTKSFVSALTGIALDKGQIKSVDDPLCSYMTEYRDLVCNEQNKTISLRNVLSMSTGLEWDEATYDYTDPRNSARIAGNKGIPFVYLFSQPRSPSTVFAYNSMNHSTMNLVLKNVTRQDNATEIKSDLLAPLGIQSFFLGKEENGVLGDIELRPRDMMKLGQLYLQNGKWNGKQIVSPGWIKESTSTSIQANNGFGYGYFWWTGKFRYRDGYVPCFFAWGYGGQYIFVVPDLKLVVAMTGSYWTTDPKNHAMEMMEKYIVASCN